MAEPHATGSPIERAATLDLRSLALCRIATGCAILLDLATRVGSWGIHYTDNGLLPRQLLFQTRTLCFPGAHLMSGWEPYLLLLLALHAAVGVTLALGYRTRLSCFLAWYLTVSLQERCFFVNNGGDRVLSTVLFWGLFLPWGEVFSVDAGGRSTDARGRRRVFSVATLILLLQPMAIYLTSAIHKIEPGWLHGDVLKYSFQSDLYARPIAHALLDYPGLLEVLSYSTWGWEIVGPFLLLSTSPRIRTFACLAFMAMHLSFGIFLRIGIFCFTPSLYMLALLPSPCWNRGPLRALASRLKGFPPRASGPPSLSLSRPTRVLLSVLFLYVVAVSLNQDHRLRSKFTAFDAPAQLLGLLGRWTVFVHSDQIGDGWVVAEGLLADGRRVGLFQGRDPVRWEKPEQPFGSRLGDRWATPLTIIMEDSRFYHVFIQALAKEWEREHPGDRVTWARLVFFVEQPTVDRHQLPARRLQAWEGYL